MIVYADHSGLLPARDLIAGLRACASAPRLGVASDEESNCRLLIETGELVQGLLDEQWERLKCDDWTRLSRRCSAIMLAAGHLLNAHEPQRAAILQRWCAALDELAILDLPETLLRIKAPEGYMHYAVYPEFYRRAAVELSRSAVRVQTVIGIRSIGTSLAAAVASAQRSTKLLVTVRPGGHPFQRTLTIGESLEQQVLASASRQAIAVVDEGPGLSGSSFAAVARWLEDRGVARRRIHFFPSHRGDLGPQATSEDRGRWHSSARHARTLDDAQKDPRALLAWITGEPASELSEICDISGGAWRQLHFPDSRLWPPAHRQLERRKFLFRQHDQVWLAKFVGLGRYGHELWDRARVLARAGMVPPPRRLCRGFLVEPWISGGRPLWPAAKLRQDVLASAREYLPLLVTAFPADRGQRGATPAELLAMARQNTAEGLGADWAAQFDVWKEHLPAIAASCRPVKTDNRLHAWEWLLTPDGRIWKADALEHHRSHDLIGSQDVAWDVAGAVAELGLSEAEVEDFVRVLRDSANLRWNPNVFRFYKCCYLAFQAGYYAMASAGSAVHQDAEAGRLQQAALRYWDRLRQELTLAMRAG